MEHKDSDGWYQILSESSGRAIANTGGTMENGTKFTTWDKDTPGDHLKVKFEKSPFHPGLPDEYYYIVFK